MANSGLPERREAAAQLRQACMTAIGPTVRGSLHRAFSAPPGGDSDMDDLLGKIK